MKTELAKPRGDLKSLINSDAVKAQIARALPRHMTPDRFTRVLTTTLLRTPKLADCDQASFMKAMLDCSAIGLEPDGRRAHLIPFENRKLNIVECQLIVDYKGLIELAKRSGEVATWQAYTVCEADSFSWRNGKVNHEIDWLSDRGAVRAYYSHVLTKEGQDDYEVMTMAEVEAIRKRSRASQSGPWVTDFDEMGKKTVMRRHSKRLTLSPEFLDAIDRDADNIENERIANARVVGPSPFKAPALPDNSPIAADQTAGISSGVPAAFPTHHQEAAGLDSQEASGDSEIFSLEAEDTFPADAAPDVQLDWLCSRGGMSEAELFGILHRAKLVGPEIKSAAAMSDKQIAKVVKSWDGILAEREGGAA